MVGESGWTVGRNPSNTTLITDDRVSRAHCQIVYQDNDFYLQDLGSTLGTFLSIEERELREGDIFELGSTSVTVLKINVQPNRSTLEPRKGKTFALDWEAGDEGADALNSYVQLRVASEELGSWECIIHNKGHIGRKATNSVCVQEDSHMSGKHCVVSRRDGKYWIADAKSMNG